MKFANPQEGRAKRFNDYVDTAATRVRTFARRRGVLNGADAQTLCLLKSKRRAALAKYNSDAFTREVELEEIRRLLPAHWSPRGAELGPEDTNPAGGMVSRSIRVLRACVLSGVHRPPGPVHHRVRVPGPPRLLGNSPVRHWPCTSDRQSARRYGTPERIAGGAN